MVNKDLFDIVDGWDSKWNLLRQSNYIRNVVTTLVLVSGVAWLIFGYDSGIGMIDEWVFSGFQTEALWRLYGQTLHFSAILFYGGLYCFSSRTLDYLKIKGSRNIVYSAFLTIFNVMLFELIYMTLFAHFQLRLNLVEWFLADSWFILQYVLIFILGVVGWIGVWGERRKKNFSFHLTFLPWFLLLTTALTFYVWVYYPFPVTTVAVDDWNNNPLFPQTHYAYMNRYDWVTAPVYVGDDLIHSVNLLAKGLLVAVQLAFFDSFRRTEKC